MEKTITIPFAPGDDLYHVACRPGDTTDGIQIFEIIREKHGIDQICIGQDGRALILDETDAVKPGPPWYCLSEREALDWAKEHLSGTLRLTGKPFRALVIDACGCKYETIVDGSLNGILAMIGNDIRVMPPDDNGILCVYNGRQETDGAFASILIRDAAGHVVAALNGPIVLIPMEKDEKSCFYTVRDTEPGELSDPRPSDVCQYDPDFWAMSDHMTMGMPRKYLGRIPDDAVLHCCGTNEIYLHYCPETDALSIDVESLSDLSEYEGRSPNILRDDE